MRTRKGRRRRERRERRNTRLRDMVKTRRCTRFACLAALSRQYGNACLRHKNRMCQSKKKREKRENETPHTLSFWSYKKTCEFLFICANLAMRDVVHTAPCNTQEKGRCIEDKKATAKCKARQKSKGIGKDKGKGKGKDKGKSKGIGKDKGKGKDIGKGQMQRHRQKA
jgi:hypothetical protein